MPSRMNLDATYPSAYERVCLFNDAHRLRNSRPFAVFSLSVCECVCVYAYIRALISADTDSNHRQFIQEEKVGTRKMGTQGGEGVGWVEARKDLRFLSPLVITGAVVA